MPAAPQRQQRFPITAADLEPLNAFLQTVMARPQPGRVRTMHRAWRNIARLPAALALSPSPKIVIAQCNVVPDDEMGCTREWVSFWLGPHCCEFWSGETFCEPLGAPDGSSSSALKYACYRDGEQEGALTDWLEIVARLDPRRATITVERI